MNDRYYHKKIYRQEKKKRDAPNRHDSKDNKKAKYIIRKITRILQEKL